jgi:enoyl-CoA hydratase/carnithine racemase
VFDAAVERGLAFARGPLALRHAKRAVDASVSMPIEAGLALEADAIAACFATEDARHGLSSFVTAGPGRAVFRGR